MSTVRIFFHRNPEFTDSLQFVVCIFCTFCVRECFISAYKGVVWKNYAFFFILINNYLILTSNFRMLFEIEVKEEKAEEVNRWD